MTRLLLGALVLAVAVAAGQTWRASRLAQRAEAAEARVAAYAEAARIRADLDRRLAGLREDAARLDHELAAGEGADAPLSDYLRAGAGRLWP